MSTEKYSQTGCFMICYTFVDVYPGKISMCPVNQAGSEWLKDGHLEHNS